MRARGARHPHGFGDVFLGDAVVLTCGLELRERPEDACALGSIGACEIERFAEHAGRVGVVAVLDERLSELLSDYEHAKEGGAGLCPCNGDFDEDAWGRCSKGGHIVVDCDRVRNRIRALAFEFPAHVPSLLANAMIALEERDRIEAQRYLDQLFAIQPVHPEGAVLRSRLALEDGNLPAAKKRIEEQLRHVPGHAGLHEALAEILFLERRYADALERIDIAEELGAPAWRAAFNRGLIAESQGELAIAADFYTAALELRPDMTQAADRLQGVRAVLKQSR